MFARCAALQGRPHPRRSQVRLPSTCHLRGVHEYAKRRRDKNREQVSAHLLGHPCADRGEADPVVLDFDHLRDKIRNISAMVIRNHPWARIFEEIAKCEVVCANCHRRRTAKRARTYRYRHTTNG